MIYVCVYTDVYFYLCTCHGWDIKTPSAFQTHVCFQYQGTKREDIQGSGFQPSQAKVNSNGCQVRCFSIAGRWQCHLCCTRTTARHQGEADRWSCLSGEKMVQLMKLPHCKFMWAHLHLSCNLSPYLCLIFLYFPIDMVLPWVAKLPPFLMSRPRDSWLNHPDEVQKDQLYPNFHRKKNIFYLRGGKERHKSWHYLHRCEGWSFFQAPANRFQCRHRGSRALVADQGAQTAALWWN